MATYNLTTKLSTEGLSDVKQTLQIVLQTFNETLSQIRAATQQTNQYLQRTVADTNRQIELSYKNSSAQIVASIAEIKAPVIKSFDAIGQSGITSAKAIAAEYTNLKQTLKTVDAQLRITGGLAQETEKRVVLASTASTSGGIRLVSDVPAGYVGVPVSGKTSTPAYDIPPNTDRDPFAFAPGVKIPQPATPKTLLGITGNTGRTSGPHLDVRYSRAYNPDRPRVSDDILNRLMVDDKPLTSYPVTSEHRSRNGGRPTHDGVDFGTPVGGKITTKVPVVYRSKPEWDNGGGGWITTVRFADGVEIVLLHQDPSVQEQIKKAQGGRAAATYQTQENQAQKQEDEARQLIEQARRRQDETRQQRNEQQRLALEDKQKTEVLKQEQAIATMPTGGRKETAELLLKVTQKENQYALERLQIEQTITQLKQERTRKLEDQDAGETPSGDYTSGRRLTRKLDGKTPAGYLGGRDYASAIAFLEKRKSLLEQNLFAEMKILAGEFEQKLSAESVKLTERLETAAKAVETLGQKFADDTPDNRMKEAIAGVSKEFDTQLKTLDEVKKQLTEQVQAKLALNWSTEQEMIQLRELQALYETLNGIKTRAVALKKVEIQQADEQQRLKRTADLSGLERQISDANADQVEASGDRFGANRIRRNAALAEARARQAIEMAKLEADRATTTDPQTIEYLDAVIERTKTLNEQELQKVSKQFETLGDVIASTVGNALSGLFDDLLSGTTNIGDAIKKMVAGILKSLAQLFSQQAFSGLTNWLKKLIGGNGGGATGGGGGGIGGFLAGLFGGGSLNGGTIDGGGMQNLIPFGPGFSTGGVVRGPGSGTSDSIPAMLSNGEGIITADAMDFWGEDGLGLINARVMPSAAFPSDFKSGTSNRSSSVNVVNVNVSSPEPSNFRQSENQIRTQMSEALLRAQRRR